jgi:hypothetical protein
VRIQLEVVVARLGKLALHHESEQRYSKPRRTQAQSPRIDVSRTGPFGQHVNLRNDFSWLDPGRSLELAPKGA